jgi:photosystem II stability/assembly factor-like uncharacterized protein
MTMLRRGSALCVRLLLLLSFVSLACGSGEGGNAIPTPSASGSVATASPSPATTPNATPTGVERVVWLAGCGSDTGFPGCTCRPGGAYCPEGLLARSSDLGHTWRSTLFDRSLSSVDFADRENGFAVGYRPTILRTRDGGASWVDWSAGVDLSGVPGEVFAFTRVRFQDSRRGFILGSYAGARCDAYVSEAAGLVLQTKDGGDTWELSEISTDIPLARCGSDEGGSFSSVCFTPEGIGLIAGNPPLLSRDGGDTWLNIEERLVPEGEGPRWFNNQVAPQGSACQPDGRLLLASPFEVWGSTDGGETWTVLDDQFNQFSSFLADLFFRDSRTGLISAGPLFRTDDGGLSWRQIDNGMPPGFGSLATVFLGETDLLSTNVNFVTVSHDDGLTWEMIGGITTVPGKLFGLSEITIVE